MKKRVRQPTKMIHFIHKVIAYKDNTRFQITGIANLVNMIDAALEYI